MFPNAQIINPINAIFNIIYPTLKLNNAYQFQVILKMLSEERSHTGKWWEKHIRIDFVSL